MWEAFFTLMSGESAGIFIIIVIIVVVWFVAALYYKWTNRIVKVEEKLPFRIDEVEEKLSNRIDEVEEKLSNRIDEVEEKLSNRIDEVEEKLSNRIDKLSNRMDKVEERLDQITLQLSMIVAALNALSSKVTALTNAFNNLVVFLAGKFNDLEVSTYLSRSPIQLSEIGLRILDKIGGRKYIDKYEDDLIAELQKFNLRTALDVQTYAPGVVFLMAERESFNEIKDFVYNNPVYKEINSEGEEVKVKLTFGNVTGLMGIYLRDKYLDKYPELIPIDPPSTRITIE